MRYVIIALLLPLLSCYDGNPDWYYKDNPGLIKPSYTASDCSYPARLIDTPCGLVIQLPEGDSLYTKSFPGGYNPVVGTQVRITYAPSNGSEGNGCLERNGVQPVVLFCIQTL